jgi:hypothetical protein
MLSKNEAFDLNESIIEFLSVIGQIMNSLLLFISLV